LFEDQTEALFYRRDLIGNQFFVGFPDGVFDVIRDVSGKPFFPCPLVNNIAEKVCGGAAFSL
jgi:hypothetical protein